MTSSSFRTSARLLGAGATVLAGLLLAVGSALPAQAHDRIVGSDPADGAQLDAAPAAITLTFNEQPLAVDPQVIVTDSTGATVLDGTPTIDGNDAVLSLPDGLAGGTYDVAWRVVSADGHPIDGELSFTVAGAPDQSPSSTPAETPTETTSTTPSEPTPSNDATAPSDAADDGGTLSTPLAIGLSVLLAAIVVGVVLLLRRRRS